MKLAYQVAMPDLESSPLLTAYQGSLEDSFRHLAENGYQGIELMVRDPQKLDPELLKHLWFGSCHVGNRRDMGTGSYFFK